MSTTSLVLVNDHNKVLFYLLTETLVKADVLGGRNKILLRKKKDQLSRVVDDLD